MEAKSPVKDEATPARKAGLTRRAPLANLAVRFPSRSETLSVLVACSLPVFPWAIFTYLYAFPGFIVRLSVWDIIGTASYPLAFALLESLFLLLLFVILSVILPIHLYKDHFVALSTVIVIISSMWMARANYLRIDFAGWDAAQTLPPLILYALSIAIPIAVIFRFAEIEKVIQAALDRVALLVYAYLGLGLCAVVIVLIRNL